MSPRAIACTPLELVDPYQILIVYYNAVLTIFCRGFYGSLWESGFVFFSLLALGGGAMP